MEKNKQKNHLSQKLIKIIYRALEEGSVNKWCVTKPEIWPEFNPQDSHAESWPANCLLIHALHAPPPHTNKCNLKYLRAGKIASQIKVFATKFEDLSSIPTTHMVERKNWLIQVILSPPLTSTCSHRHTLGKTDNMYMHRHSYNWQNTHTYMQTHTEKEDFKNEI